LDKLERLKQLLDNLEKLGWDVERTTQYLSRITDLNDEIKKGEKELSEIEHQCAQKREACTKLQETSRKAAAYLKRINDATTKAQLNLNDLVQKSKEKSDQLEFAESLHLLLQDPSKIPLSLLVNLDVELQMIIQAKFDPKFWAYPIDYASLREKALSLIEQVLGKSFVRRELFDEMLRRSVEKHDDLMLGILGIMECERTKLAEEKADLAAMKAAEARILQKAANLHAKCSPKSIGTIMPQTEPEAT
jgi:hypothetical protein